jgi:hypothetical protein
MPRLDTTHQLNLDKKIATEGYLGIYCRGVRMRSGREASVGHCWRLMRIKGFALLVSDAGEC